MECKPLKYFNYFKNNDIYYEMALDEILLFEAITTGLNFLRIYSISSSSLTYGYFYKIKDTNVLLPHTRRITGGGIVEHSNDLIISFIFSKINSIKDVSYYYDLIHKIIKKILCELFSNDFNLMDKNNKNNALRVCFESPVKSDIITKNKKIVGGALARKKDFFLYQGSIQLKELTEDTNLINLFLFALMKHIENEFNMRSLQLDINENLHNNALQFAKKKYEKESWIRKF